MNEMINIDSPLKVLSLEDDVFDFELISKLLLKSGYNLSISRVESKKEYETLLRTNDYDVILSDFKLPGFNAFGSLQLCKVICPDVPFICVSGTIGEETAIELLKQGAIDYVLKDKLERLPFAIKRALDETNEKQIRRLAEEELKKSEERFRHISSTISDISYSCLKKGNEIELDWMTGAAEQITGYSINELLTKRCWGQLIIDEDFDIFTTNISNLVPGNSSSCELRMKHKNGKIVWIESFAECVIEAGQTGNQIIYGGLVDITVRKHVETELIKAKEKAEESDRLKTAFLHNITHEIRTPMNAIVGFSGLINDPEMLPDERKQFTEIIIQSSNQLLSIITDIVSIATIEAGQEKIRKNEININTLCEQVFKQCSPVASEKKIDLSFSTILPDDEALLVTDETKLIQILNNLVFNALKFTKEGFVKFGYRLKSNDKSEELEFFVEDSGIGIAKKMQEEIFKRFRQVEDTTSRKYGGSGLGLSISKAYIELLGGKVWLKSALGKGSIFYFSIPYHRTEPKELTDKISTTSNPVGLRKSKSLLIAEDEDSNFRLLELMLSGLNFKILRAIDGKKAVDICTSTPVDLVLMDIKMPVMDGYEATKQIIRIKPNLPIIAQTAYSTESDKHKALNCGCCGFISKPIMKDILLTKINECLLAG
ncbi:MAG: response regulator [Bacteroidales bacterium]|nr:response regulator [Bacteroidales bacterium]